MGATVVNGLTASYWAGAKPPDYKNTDLDKALKTYEGVAGKTVTFSKSLMPPVPKSTITDITACITDLKSAIADLEKAKTLLNPIVTALKAVITVANKTSTDLKNLSKGKDVDEKKYLAASTNAGSISFLAAGALKDVQ